MKKDNSLNDKIMGRVVKFEKKRIYLYIWEAVISIIFFSSIAIILFSLAKFVLEESETLEIISLFKEDRETIGDLWQEIYFILKEEIPWHLMFGFLGSFTITMVISIIFIKNFHLIKNRLKTIRHYLRKHILS
ncbi:hypothetical protein HZB78_03395 [Candidatus Collierbacteria bacterium]|nr:hypothetical protein [Candidatus Collierbacteria bacterium]